MSMDGALTVEDGVSTSLGSAGSERELLVWENAELREQLHQQQQQQQQKWCAAEACQEQSPHGTEDYVARSASRRSTKKEDVDARLQEAVAENEEVLARNQELNDKLRDLQRQQRLDRQSLEQQEAVTYELAGKVRCLERENARVRGSFIAPRIRSVGCSRWQFTSPGALSDVINSPEVQPGASDEALDAEATVTGLLRELSLLKQEHDDTVATCGELRYALDFEREATERSHQELSASYHEIQLLLEAERQRSERGWQEVERLQLAVASQQARLKSILLSAKNSDALASYPKLMRQLVRASVQHGEHDIASDGSRSDDVGFSPSPQRWQRAQFWSPTVPSGSLRRQPSSDQQATACEEHPWHDIPTRPSPRTKMGTLWHEAKMGGDVCPLHECIYLQQQLDNAKDELHAARTTISHLESQATQGFWERFIEQAVCCRRQTRPSETGGAGSPHKFRASVLKLR